MIKDQISTISLFLLLCLLQVFLFNRIDFLGFANPMVYLLFIITYPYGKNRVSLLITSFLLGLVIDAFSDTGGIYATSALFVAYIRPLILKFVFGRSLEHQKISLRNFSIPKMFVYTSLLVFIHHIALFFLEAFSFHHFLMTLYRIGVNTILTIFFCIVGIVLFDRGKA